MATLQPIRKAHQEHSVPWFWPFAAAIELGEEGVCLFQRNVEFLVQAHLINVPPMPEWSRALAIRYRQPDMTAFS